ncbi:Armadillo repeat-containing protein 6 [Mactra antiquata]
MAKQISQETFDDVVRENVEDFEMTVEDALTDAVQQFESQGVNLAMIIKDSSLYSSGGEKNTHPVVEALSSLSLDGNASSDTDDVKHLGIVKEECDIDLARRCFAGKNKAYPVLLKCMQKYRKGDEEMFLLCLDTMCSLCNGQPDLLDREGVELFMDVMRDENNSPLVTERIVKLVRLNCIKHETNRGMFVKNGLIKELVSVLTSNRKVPSIVKEVASGLRSLTQDDDIRVPFGSAHENAKQIVIEGDALKELLQICSDYTSDVGVQGELFSTLSKLVVRDEFCKEVKDLGGLDLILKSFQENITKKSIVKQALELLKALAGNDEIKQVIVKSGGVQSILAAMTQHQGNPQIAAGGCQVLAVIVLRQPTHCSVVIDNNGHHVILQAMKVHPTDETVQQKACMAIRNIVARTRDHCSVLLELGAEDLINKAKSISSCVDDAKAALRDLGCQVELQERWTGEKGSLPQSAY